MHQVKSVRMQGAARKLHLFMSVHVRKSMESPRTIFQSQLLRSPHTKSFKLSNLLSIFVTSYFGSHEKVKLRRDCVEMRLLGGNPVSSSAKQTKLEEAGFRGSRINYLET